MIGMQTARLKAESLGRKAKVSVRVVEVGGEGLLCYGIYILDGISASRDFVGKC